MSALSTAQVLENAASAAAERFAQREVERAVSLTGHPTRPLTKAEHAAAIAILRGQGCVPSEITMRLGVTQ